MKKRNKKILTLILATSILGSLLAESSIVTKAKEFDKKNNTELEVKNNLMDFNDETTDEAVDVIIPEEVDNTTDEAVNIDMLEIQENGQFEDIAMGKPATSSSGQNSAALAVDGNSGSRWESETKDPQWICIDLGGNFKIKKVKLKWEGAGAEVYNIQLSKDGNKWGNIAEVTDGKGGETRELDCDETVTGRYIRMYGTKRVTTYGYSIFDFEVYGRESGFKSISGKSESVKLKWYAEDSAKGYNIYRSSNADSGFEKINKEPITGTEYTDTDELDIKKYYYKLKSIDENNDESEVLDYTSITIVEDLDLGDKVKIFDPSMPKEEIQNTVDEVFNEMETEQFGTGRYALLFKPGKYNTNVNVGFYTSVMGLGKTPDDVDITGAVRCEADWFPEQPGNATQNFWRTVENISVTPKYKSNNVTSEEGDLTWAVSQAAPMRRTHIKGNVSLWDPYENDYDLAWASGGFIADSKVDGKIGSASQQQFFTRNVDMDSWNGSNWNMVFVGDQGTPKVDDDKYVSGEAAYTVVDKTPIIREKPFLYIDDDGKYKVFVPDVRKNVQGVSWENGLGKGESLSVTDTFYIAKPEKDTADTLNEALNEGKNILFTPGIYYLNKELHITRPDTIILGIGLATLNPNNRNAAIVVDDVDGVNISGLLFNAAQGESPYLLKVGEEGSHKDHSENPILLADLFFRVGGDGKEGARAKSCIVINSDDVIGDHFWVWRADHGDGVGWELNRCDNGLVVNGNNVTIYGLFVEHFNEYQTLWNGENGKVYFYQTEFPYDVPNQEAWMSNDGTVNGYASYKVGDTVKNHELYGAGLYTYFTDADVVVNSPVEIPNTPNVKVKHACSVFLNAYGGATHVVNNTGGAVNSSHMRSAIDFYCNKVGDPAIKPSGGVFSSEQSISIDCAVEGAQIRYTTDGRKPTEKVGTIYTGPFTVDYTTTIKAIAYKEGMESSDISTSTITIKPGLADNIALGKPAKASSGNAALAFDGDANTRWASNWESDEYISVDLGTAYTISEINLLWESAYATKYKIQISNDGVNWTNAYFKNTPNYVNITDSVIDIFNKNTTGGSESISFLKPISARYIKMQGVQPITEYGYSIYEFEVHGEKYKIDETNLRSLYEQHKNKVQGKYTNITWKLFTSALDSAKDILDKDKKSQEEIDTAYNNLLNAINGLKEANNSNSGSSGGSSGGGNSSGGSSSGGGSSSNSNNEEVIDKNDNSEKETGWIKDENNGKWHYLDVNSGEKKTGWFKDTDGKWYYLDFNSGEMKTGWFKDSNNKWYHLGTSGAMTTGWFKDSNNKWYHLGTSGAMTIGWFKDSDNKWYHLGVSGDMTTGWFKDSNNKWYHLGASGAMTIGWLKDTDRKWYYLNSDGSMAYDTYIDGYYVNSNGVYK
ncbi:discoidin domain-containing protein [Clostridium sp.]|nr:discoidin domain-containing protein [Clostridium sp.]MDU4476216.1 discoidin domain-containing protein [Clostridium sp.]